MARSTFYYQKNVAGLRDKYADLRAMIATVYHTHRGRYGYRRITLALRQLGQCINHKTVQRLMRQLGLKSLVRPKRYKSYRGNAGMIAADQLKRQFDAAKPNEKWVTDVTEFKVAGEKLYLSPVMDLFNREIIAFETSDRPQFNLVGGMLDKALNLLGKDDHPILHSDQGWQYQSPHYQKKLRAKGLTLSMSRKGNCLDNAAMESFFAVLKSEFFYPNKFQSLRELQDGIADYIHYYNHDRIKPKLKGLSPVQYRTQPHLIPTN